jgi:hypothetical protein
MSTTRMRLSTVVNRGCSNITVQHELSRSLVCMLQQQHSRIIPALSDASASPQQHLHPCPMGAALMQPVDTRYQRPFNARGTLQQGSPLPKRRVPAWRKSSVVGITLNAGRTE